MENSRFLSYQLKTIVWLSILTSSDGSLQSILRRPRLLHFVSMRLHDSLCSPCMCRYFFAGKWSMLPFHMVTRLIRPAFRKEAGDGRHSLGRFLSATPLCQTASICRTLVGAQSEREMIILVLLRPGRIEPNTTLRAGPTGAVCCIIVCNLRPTILPAEHRISHLLPR